MRQQALAPFRDHLHEQFGRVLQVDIHRHHGIARGVLQPGGKSRLLTEIAAEVDHPNLQAGILLAQHHGEAVIRAAIIDEDEFERDVWLGCEVLLDASQENFDRFRFVVDRYDD